MIGECWKSLAQMVRTQKILIWTIPSRILPSGNLSPGQLPPRIILTMKIISWKLPTQENSQLENFQPRKFLLKNFLHDSCWMIPIQAPISTLKFFFRKALSCLLIFVPQNVKIKGV